MAQPTVRKRPAGHAADEPITLPEGSNGDNNDDRRDSQWLPVPVETGKPTDTLPTSCFGHFDRVDLEYAPKPKTKAKVVVYHDSPIVSWSNTSFLTGTRTSSRDIASGGDVDNSEERVMRERNVDSISSSLQDGNASTEGETLSSGRRRRVTRSMVPDAIISEAAAIA